MFDADRYDREILRPLRGTHGQLPASDLLARYAVEPGMDADELTRHLTTVRAWWRVRAGGPDFRAEVCRLLIQADAELAAAAGAAMNDPAWWQEQARMNAGTPRTVEQPAAEPPGAATAAEEPTAAPHDWRANARARFWASMATVDREPAPATRPAARSGQAPPGAPGGPGDTGLAIAAIDADHDRCHIEVSWPARDGEVEIRSCATPPDFGAGEDLPREIARSWGEPLSGTPHQQGDRRVLTAVVPSGYRIYVPFEVAGERVRTGRPVGLSLAGPVRRLRIEPRGDGALISWNWPPGAATAEVDWTGSGVTEHRIVTLAEYTAANGCPVAVATQGGSARVRAITAVGKGVAYSPARSVTLAPAPVELSYTVRRRRLLGSGELVVAVTADRPCPELWVDVVVSTGRFLPLEPANGTVHARFGPLSLTAGAAVALRAPWPDVPRRDRPAWIRCFFRAGQPFTPVDPPIDAMRIT